ncbi:MAG TPA: collagen-like protein [Pyrinomonadaceae bacterium]|nr:collagen-like protein [Pyrinomonadaceae bacterium]
MRLKNIFLVWSILLLCAAAVFAQTSAFSYQGRLNDASLPANGSYDLQFALYDAVSAGTQVGTTQTLTGVTISQGIFSVTLDFGAAAFTGADRFLEMRVKKPADATYTTLAPRQLITSAPYSVFANSPQGPQGIQGIQGIQGPPGATGATGAPGATGPAGPAGPQGIVGFVTSAGLGLSTISTTNTFIGPTVNVTVAAGQKVMMNVTKAMGSTAAGGATGLNIYPCYQNTAGGTLTTQNLGIFGLTSAQNDRQQFGINYIFSGLAAGTYTIGMCGSSTNAANWNNNEWGYISAIIFN